MMIAAKVGGTFGDLDRGDAAGWDSWPSVGVVLMPDLHKRKL